MSEVYTKSSIDGSEPLRLSGSSSSEGDGGRSDFLGVKGALLGLIWNCRTLLGAFVEGETRVRVRGELVLVYCNWDRVSPSWGSLLSMSLVT
jgi:hypothetical protein